MWEKQLGSRLFDKVHGADAASNATSSIIGGEHDARYDIADHCETSCLQNTLGEQTTRHHNKYVRLPEAVYE